MPPSWTGGHYNCIIAGHTIVTEDTVIPPNSIVAGAPGKVKATRNNLIANRLNALASRQWPSLCAGQLSCVGRPKQQDKMVRANASLNGIRDRNGH